MSTTPGPAPAPDTRIERQTPVKERLVAFGETGHAGLIGVGGAILAFLLLLFGVAGYASLKGDVSSVQEAAATAQATASTAHSKAVNAQAMADKAAADLLLEVGARRKAVSELSESLKNEVARLDKRADGLSADLGAEERRTRRLAKLVGQPVKGEEKRSHEERLAALEGDCDEETPSQDDSKPAAGAIPGAPTADATPPPAQ